jgi:acid phosphatase
MQRSVEYQAAVASVYRLATAQLDANLANPTLRAMVEQATDESAAGKPPAVVLDIDETVLDNSPFQGELIGRDSVFSPALWGDWVRLAKAKALPGAVEFCQQAKAKGIQVIFITNRGEGVSPAEREAHESLTRANLLNRGFSLDDAPDAVLTPGEHEWAADKSTDKTARRKWVAARYRVIALVGDDFGDFVSVSGLDPEKREALRLTHAGRWGVTWFAIPNPTYGSWLRALTKGTDAGDPAVLDKKRGQLRGFNDGPGAKRR